MNALHDDSCHPPTKLFQNLFKVFYTAIAKRLSSPRVLVGDIRIDHTIVFKQLAGSVSL